MTDTFTLTAVLEAPAQGDVDRIVEALEARQVEITTTLAEPDVSAVDSAIEDIEAETPEIGKPTVPAPDTTTFKAGMDDLDHRSDQSKSVLANLSGNAAQDLGEIGGIAGTTGVALGQLAEYATEGNIALSQVGKVAGPMLAITIATEVATRAFAAFTKKNEELAKNTRELTSAFVESTGGVDAWTSSVEKAVEAGTADPGEAFSASFFEAWDEDKANDVLAALGDLGLSAGDVGDQMLGATNSTQAWATEQLSAAGATDEFAAAVGGAMAEGNSYADAVDIVAHSHENMSGALDATGQALLAEGDALAVAGSALDELGDAADDADIEAAATTALNAAEGYEEYAAMVAQARDETDSEAEALKRFQALMIEANGTREEAAAAAEAQAKADGEAAKALEEAAAGADAFGVAIGGVDYQNAALEGATTAMSAYSEALFASGNEVQASEAAYGKLATALTDTTLQFDEATEAGFAQQDAIEQLSGVVDGQLADAYDKAGGNFDAFALGAANAAADIRGTLINTLDLSVDEANEVLDAMGLLDDKDIEARFALAGAEEARMKLGLLSSAITGLPPNVERQVTMAVTAGDYTAALKLVEDYYAANHPEIISEVTADMEGYTDVVGQAVEDAEGVVTIIPVGANPDEATEVIGEVVEDAEGNTAMIPADADVDDAASDLLDVTTKQREAVIKAIPQAGNAEYQLDQTAKPRTSNVKQIAYTGDAERELNQTARTRTSYVNQYVRTYGGGSSTTTAAATGLSAVPMTAPAPAPVNVTINTSVIGDRYDVQRTVARAVRGAVRLHGVRAA